MRPNFIRSIRRLPRAVRRATVLYRLGMAICHAETASACCRHAITAGKADAAYIFACAAVNLRRRVLRMLGVRGL